MPEEDPLESDAYFSSPRSAVGEPPSDDPPSQPTAAQPEDDDPRGFNVRHASKMLKHLKAIHAPRADILEVERLIEIAILGRRDHDYWARWGELKQYMKWRDNTKDTTR